MTTIQKIQLPLNYEPPQLYCPACGAAIIGNFDSDICKHLVFVSDPAGSGVDLIGENYVRKFEELSELREDTSEDLLEKFLEKYDQESFLKFDVKFGGVSHGIDWYNITAIFDFAP